MDRRFLAVEEGKPQEGGVEGRHRDDPEEGQDGREEGRVLQAAEQPLCTICDTRLKRENMNAGLDFPFNPTLLVFAVFQISKNKP